jgi:membrane protein implicated in regulation of membrane protease activity
MSIHRHSRQQGWQQVARDEALIGCIGKVVVATRGQGGPGEVVVKVRGGSEALIAWSATSLPRGTTVLVIESRGHRTVDVSQWDDPLESFPAGSAE